MRKIKLFVSYNIEFKVDVANKRIQYFCSQEFIDYLYNKQNPDIFQVDDQCISAHRIVLAATIPYFRAMFVHDMLEARKKDIPMKDIDAK